MVDEPLSNRALLNMIRRRPDGAPVNARLRELDRLLTRHAFNGFELMMMKESIRIANGPEKS